MKKILFIISLIGLFSCVDKRQEALKNYLQKANDVCKGDTTGVHLLHDNLSANAQNRVDNVQGYLVYLLVKTTKKGTIENIEILETKRIKWDSVACKVKLTFLDKSKTIFKQSLVSEKGQWKVGL